MSFLGFFSSQPICFLLFACQNLVIFVIPIVPRVLSCTQKEEQGKGCLVHHSGSGYLLLSLFILFYFFKNYLFIYLFRAVLGLRFCVRAFSSCGKWGPLFIAVRGPLTIVASPVAEHRLQTHRLSNRGSWAQPLCGMWDLPRPGLEPVSPASAGRFSTTAPPGKPSLFIFLIEVQLL